MGEVGSYRFIEFEFEYDSLYELCNTTWSTKRDNTK